MERIHKQIIFLIIEIDLFLEGSVIYSLPFHESSNPSE